VGAGVNYRPLTLIVPYYENPDMFREQQRQWFALKEDVRSALHVIVVDDGSPASPAVDAVLPETRTDLASFRLFRTKVDVRWNWLFCRNLGVEQAKTEWVLMTDMDHVIPYETWRRLMRGKLDPLRVYRLSRIDAATKDVVKPHPNTWIMTRHMFRERVGGYDERFSGYYGTDGEFQKRVDLWARDVHIMPEVAIVYPETLIADACTTRYTRKEEYDRENVRRIKHERGVDVDWRPKRLTFPWESVL
jgi:hypothetical protein